jgi:3-methyl-2-oxobutanoate hydroxymethyltransferase
MYGNSAQPSDALLGAESATNPTNNQVVPIKRNQERKQDARPKQQSGKKRPRKITVRTIRRMKEQGEKITMLTAYDTLFAQMLERAGIEMLLVGDSLGMVVQGEDHTLAVTLDEMIYHTRCVARRTQRAMIVGDMPFMSYQSSPEQALENAGRLVKEGGAHAVKLEGGSDVVDAVRKITRAGIPVVGHIGLTPQSVHAFGGFVVQGRDEKRAQEIRKDAMLLQEAGAFCIVLEGIPAPLSEQITNDLAIPTIGIGAGIHCDGQVLVTQDMLGLNPDFTPRFVKRFANLHNDIEDAFEAYLHEVKSATFPTNDHSFF